MITAMLKTVLIGAATLSISAPAAAQMNMPGMPMPAPAKKVAPKKNPAAKKKAPKKAAAKKDSAKAAPKPSVAPTEHGMTIPATSHSDHADMPMPAAGGGAMPPMEHDQMPGMSIASGQHAGHAMSMTGALGAYPIERESSGTAWEPDTSGHMGLMTEASGWTLMAHGVLNLVTDHQSGPRGADKAFASGMVMGMARRPLGNGTLQLRGSISPDPLMVPRGYPLLLANGETANGRDRLIDRQHPHDLFMELSASVSQNVGSKSSVFVYAGLPGEPAFGPPAFMHRQSIMDSPEAPISHHWLDSTHISFGVLTAGVVLDRVKVEVSRFNAREPDQHRWNIETGALDSTAVRLSWNPTANLALQGSWGRFKDPEQLEPGVNQNRLSASALYARDVASGWRFAGTLAWGRKTAEHHSDDAFAAEASLKHKGWTIFGRGEVTENRELLAAGSGPAYRVGKVSLGALRDFAVSNHVSVGAGGLASLNFVPEPLARLYGGHNPGGAMAFVRVKLD